MLANLLLETAHGLISIALERFKGAIDDAAARKSANSLLDELVAKLDEEHQADWETLRGK